MPQEVDDEVAYVAEQIVPASDDYDSKDNQYGLYKNYIWFIIVVLILLALCNIRTCATMYLNKKKRKSEISTKPKLKKMHDESEMTPIKDSELNGI